MSVAGNDPGSSLVEREDAPAASGGAARKTAGQPATGRRMRSFVSLPLLAAGLFSGSVVVAQATADDEVDKDPSEWTETETGIPVTDPLTIQKCGTCHTPDAKGNLSRISWVRTTPEAWAQTIKRMVKLNGLSITPQEARSVVHYLGTWHGLAPDEAKPVMYFAERRIQDETIIPNETMHVTCAGCHAFAQPMSSRRSHREWALLQNMHRALYSQAEYQFGQPADGDDTDGDTNGDTKGKKPTMGQVALAWLSKNADLHSAAWADWRPRIRTPQLAGKWIVSGRMPGHGRFVGTMTITLSGDEFSTTTTLRSLETGATSTRTGKGFVYAGYSWRGTTSGGGTPVRPDDMSGQLRETMWFSPDHASAQGRWYWGEYHEFGLDVNLMRATGAPVIAAVSPTALRTGTKGAQVHLYGDTLPGGLAAGDLDFGNGVTVRKVQTLSPSEAVVTLDVSPDAIVGEHDVALNGAVLAKALPIYSSIDYLKVTPETALAHLGGIKFAKGYQQFTAEGWSKGADGKLRTADDFAVMPVDAEWSMQEFPTVTYDDDIKFVGTLGADGLFTPNAEGPEPKRRFSRNNYGEVWVVAQARTLKDGLGNPLSARAYLVTTVPTYKRWDQPEVFE